MAKVNLLTIHYGKCYGAVMQTFATCRMLEDAGHSVCVINLIDGAQRNKWKTFDYWKDSVREFQFWLFKRRYFPKLSNKAYSIQKIKLPDADVTIVGSDQVWNRDITGSFGNTFYLDFVEGSRKIALSSSFGKEHWEESPKFTNKVRQLLSQFNAISVREASGVDIIKEVMGLGAINLLDPTLGYGKFENLLLNHKQLHQVFPFLLLDDEEAMGKANYIAKYLDLPLFKHTTISSHFFNGPRHWLTRIKNSDYVITDSFHGLALSIIFRKQFFVFCASEKKFTRLRSLLKLLSLEDRYVESIEDFDNRKISLLKPIDYLHVGEILNNEQEHYRAFIQDVI